ncbi:RNA polymerase subunit sigma-70 [Macrococcus armenti]|uniref:sigma factor-like helix-turn-helix DNA-binding protein n=1 Tax=Macrococcus armenti TaxID=2875764 RepID=UPI001CCC4A57|nr:sigma factor-like helix-turn-helix DNA-binding protein [Macrococcus armenti]UBH22342.1 RNA polymerase subunit sigma-70 [Macrococcus armenti]
MKQKVEDIKTFIKYYSQLNIETTPLELNDNIDTFFITNNIDDHYTINEHIDDIAYMNEILYLAEAVGTDKEFYIFYLMSEGRTLEEVGKVFSLSRGRVRQVYDDVIIKIISKQ